MKQITYNGPPGVRLGRYLSDVHALPQGIQHKYLRENRIKLNGRKAPLSTRLAPGDVLRLYLPMGKPSPAPVILYEDGRLLAVEKPPGIASGDNGCDTEGSMLYQVRAWLAEQGGGTVFLCHRLDTGTSGVLLLAKDTEMLAWVESLMREKKLVKHYLCVTVGTPQPPQGTLSGYLTKDAARGVVHIHQKDVRGSKPVRTGYRTLATSGRLALLEVELITGRTHQIRAHLASIGTPILGDGKYGDNAINRELRCKRQCLCASEVLFPGDVPLGYEAYAGLSLHCKEPWYARQLREGSLK